MGKKSVDPESKSIAGEPKLMGKLANKIMHNLDIDKLADSVAEQIGERIIANFATSELVDKLFQKYQEELQANITEAIIQRLYKKWTTQPSQRQLFIVCSQ